MKTYLKKHKKFLILFGILLCLLAISGPFFRSFGHRLIEDMYYGRTLPCLNGLIEDQDRRSLEVYLSHGNRFFKQFRGYFLSPLFLFGIYFLYTLVPVIRNKKVQNIVVLLLVIVTISTLTELFLRYLMPVQLGEITFANYQPSANPEIVIEPRPSSGLFNAAGFRDYEYTREKPEGIYRIVVIGDSLAYGLRVGLEDTYAKRLEKKLNEQSKDGKKYQVINMGVPGYRTVQTIARLQEKGLAYDPDMIIYGYWLDDISYSGLVPFYFNRTNLDMSEKINRLMARNPVERKVKKLLLNSQIVRRCILLAREFQRRRDGDTAANVVFPVGENMKDLEPGIQALYKKYLDSLNRGDYRDAPGGEPYYARYADFDDFVLWNNGMKEFAGICRERHIRCLLLMTPIIYDYEDGDYRWESLHRFIRAVAGNYSLPVLDLTDTFHTHEAYRLRAGDLEHPSALGHKLIADKLYKWIVNEID